MIRKLASLLLALALLCAMLPCSTALAAIRPAIPAPEGPVVDAASVLTAATVNDLRQLCQTIANKTGVNLQVVSVDFTDGLRPGDYADQLYQQWHLGTRDLLLLMIVGQDQCALLTGNDVKLSHSACDKLSEIAFKVDDQSHDYNQAMARFAPALADELSKTYNTTISTAGLFGTPAAAEQPAENWKEQLNKLLNSTANNTPRHEDRSSKAADNDDDDGIFGWIVLAIILLLIFGNGKKRRRSYDRRFRGGRGRTVLTTFLAIFGLWKLWDRHH